MSIHLGNFFARAKPVRRAATLILVVVATVISLIMVVQSTQTSGEQSAMALVGNSDYSLRLPTPLVLGADQATSNDDVLAAMRDAGATSAHAGYFVGQVPVDGQPELDPNLWELDWNSDPFPKRFTLRSGHLPIEPGDVAISTTLADNLPEGAKGISLAAGTFELRVVGVVSDDTQRDASFGLVAPGTWDSAAELEVDRSGVAGAREFYWDDDTAPDLMVDVIVDTLKASDAALTVDETLPAVADRAGLEADKSRLYSELTVLLLLAPFAAALIGSFIGSRFVVRIRATLFQIGVSRTRLAGVVSIGGTAALASVAGIGVGIALGLAVRPILDNFSTKALGPVYGLETIAPSLVAVTIVGVSFGMLRLSGGSIEPRRVRAGWIPSLGQVLPTISIVLVIAGLICAQSSDLNIRFASAYLIGFAVVVLAPVGITLLALLRPSSPPVLLALRRVKAELKHSGWTAIAVASILMLSFSLSTIFYSAVESANAQAAAKVPPGQVHLTIPEATPDGEGLRVSFEEYADLGEPVEFARAEMSPELSDGAIIIVDGRQELERLLDISLSGSQAAAFESGSVLRPKPSPGGVEAFSTGAESFELPLVQVEGVDPSFARYGGFAIKSLVDDLGVATTQSTFAYLSVTSAQQLRVDAAPDALNFNPGWIREYQPPKLRSEPPEMILIAIVAGLVAGLLMAYFAASNTRALRPNLAALRSIGVRPIWLTSVVGVQIGAVLVVSVTFALLAALVASYSAFRLWMTSVQLHIPWLSISLLAAALLVMAASATLAAGKRLNAVERLESR